MRHGECLSFLLIYLWLVKATFRGRKHQQHVGEYISWRMRTHQAYIMRIFPGIILAEFRGPTDIKAKFGGHLQSH
jgi:hypothetical protein